MNCPHQRGDWWLVLLRGIHQYIGKQLIYLFTFINTRRAGKHPHIIVFTERDSICPTLTKDGQPPLADPRYNLMGVLRYYTLSHLSSYPPTKPTRPMQTLLIESKYAVVIIVSKDRASRLNYLLHDDRLWWDLFKIT